jgi:hypothetical protein
VLRVTPYAMAGHFNPNISTGMTRQPNLGIISTMSPVSTKSMDLLINE